MRIQNEHVTVTKIFRTVLDAPDAGIPVLDRGRKVAGLKRRAHPLVFAGGDAALKDETLGPSADSAVQRAHDDVAELRRRHQLVAYLSLAWRHRPECAGFVSGHSPILVLFARALQSRRRVRDVHREGDRGLRHDRTAGPPIGARASSISTAW